MTNYTNVAARAMLVSLHVSTWSARKFDKAATSKVNTDHKASQKAGRFNKHLLAGAEEHEQLISACEAARELHYSQTLPWSDKGSRLLPTKNFMEYTKVMRKQFGIMDARLETFVAAYPTLVEAAEKQHTALGQLFNRAEYPRALDIKRRFSWSLKFDKVPDGDIRVDLPEDVLAEISAEARASAADRVKEAMDGAWERLHEAVARIHKATHGDGIVRSTLIENARNVCDVLARLNVADDAELEGMRQRVEKELAQLDLEDLRKDDKVRKDTAKKAKKIMDAMSAFYAPPAKDTEAA